MQIHSTQMGEGDQPMLMIHCALARSEAMLRLAAPCAGEYRITLFDLPGHGRSDDFPPGADVHRQTCDIAKRFLDGPTHVVGHSFGGTIALRLAVENPELVSRLTLIEPVYFKLAEGTAAHDQHVADFAPVSEAFRTGDTRRAAREFLDVWGGGQPFDRLPERQQAQVLRSISIVHLSENAVHFDTDGVLAPGTLERITCPVTVVEGAQSHPVIAEIGKTVQRRIPGADRVVIDEAGHMVPLTHPDAVAGVVLR